MGEGKPYVRVERDLVGRYEVRLLDEWGMTEQFCTTFTRLGAKWAGRRMLSKYRRRRYETFYIGKD